MVNRNKESYRFAAFVTPELFAGRLPLLSFGSLRRLSALLHFSTKYAIMRDTLMFARFSF